MKSLCEHFWCCVRWFICMPRVFIMMIAGLGEVFSAYIFAQKKRKSKSREENAIDLWQKVIKSFCSKRKKKLFAYSMLFLPGG